MFQMKNQDLWNGNQYKKNSSPQETSATNIINSISFNKDDCVLDIGCGDGRVTKKLCSLVPKGKVVGIDPSNSMILEANKLTESCSNLSFFQKSAEDFKIEIKFNYILSFHSLHWVKDKKAIFDNIYSHLKPGGKFVFVTAGRENKCISSVFSSERWINKIRNHSQKFQAGDQDQINQRLQDSGFSVESFESEYRSIFYDKKEDLIKWTMTWIPYATGLNEEESGLFANEIAEKMREQSLNDGIEDKIEFKTEMFIVTAMKERPA